MLTSTNLHPCQAYSEAQPPFANLNFASAGVASAITETDLDRKLERMLAMLLRLKELRQETLAG